ncbi:uncharacterized protein At1g08160-like [Cucurbita pepo subsp. pepo]|uniref:uncharacterized protein At1g08160-like n=1 Tax=Cucurbita pepo subsp. pepo TaxID=3664 RepID=UPI000C9D5101|nr:uncharacterized protein At1g08160-like [Cucurbita pepo subsp. pepo]
MRSNTQGEASSSTTSIIEAPKPSSYGHQHGTAKRTKLMRIIGRSLLAVMFLVGLAIVICWLVVFPKTPNLILENGHVTPHSLTDRKLNASISFTIKSYNPNKRASIHMDSMKMTLDDMGQTFTTTIPTFTQPPGNQTFLNPTVEVNFIYPFGQMKDLMLSDGLNPELHFSAHVSYIVEKWASKRRSLEIYCDRVRLKINGSTPFDNTKCKVDL